MRLYVLFSLFLLMNSLGFSEGKNIVKEKNFSEIVLGDFFKDPSIRKINTLIEEAEATLDNDKLKEVERLIKLYIEKEPKNFLFYYFLSRVQFSLFTLFEERGDIIRGSSPKKVGEFLDLSLQNAKKSINLNKNFSDAYRIASDIYGRLIPLKNPIFYGPLYGPRAEKLVEKAIKLNPKNPEAYLSKGRCFLFTPAPFGGSKKKALEYFKKAESVCPSYYMNYMWLGECYVETGKLEEAKESFKKALELEPRCSWAKWELERLK